jgi:predicted aspartyl protease
MPSRGPISALAVAALAPMAPPGLLAINLLAASLAASAARPALARPVALGALIQLAGRPLSGGTVQGEARLPLERAAGGDTPVLEFQVLGAANGNGRLRLLLDTGASSTMVTPELAQRLGLASAALPPAAFQLAGGGQGCAALAPRRTRLPDLRLGANRGLVLRGAEALVLPVAALPAGVDGVLGAPTLRLLPFRIDPVAGQVVLGPGALQPPPPRAALRLALRWHRHVPLLQLASAAGPVAALADTGAEGLFLQPALAARLQPLDRGTPLRLVGFCGEQPVLRQRFLGLALPGLAPPPGQPNQGLEGIVTANPIFAQLGVGAIVGQELLRQQRQLWRLDRTPPQLLLW